MARPNTQNTLKGIYCKSFKSFEVRVKHQSHSQIPQLPRLILKLYRLSEEYCTRAFKQMINNLTTQPEMWSNKENQVHTRMKKKTDSQTCAKSSMLAPFISLQASSLYQFLLSSPFSMSSRKNAVNIFERSSVERDDRLKWMD
ncbi:Uncharacterized protein Fot_14717 [Forsythia ovata]|uniref:Uncharacterized protein n=1 Tax=Forsythia ovata TaxID=205694 RepID=A0ABD1W741_9LAMI